MIMLGFIFINWLLRMAALLAGAYMLYTGFGDQGYPGWGTVAAGTVFSLFGLGVVFKSS